MTGRHGAWTVGIGVALAASMPAPVSTPQERPPRLVPPLTLPAPPPTRPAGDPPRERRPVVELTLSEAAPPPVEREVEPRVTTLPPERARALLARLPPPVEPSGPSAAPPASGGDRSAPAPSRDPRGLSVVSVLPSGQTELAVHVTVVFSRPMVPLGRDGEPVAGPVPAELTPRPPGAWRWLDARTLRFEPGEERLPGATAYRVRVSGDAVSADGAALGEAYEATFRTAGPRALGGFPHQAGGDDANPAGRRPDVLFVFDQRVHASDVARSVRLSADGVERRVGPVALDELASRRPSLARAAREAGEGMWAAFRPRSPLPVGSDVVVRLDASLPSAEGPLPAGRVQELRFRVHGSFEALGSPCPAENPCPPFRHSVLSFSNPLDPDRPVPDLVRVRPDVEGLRITHDGSWVGLIGDFRPDARYTVEVGGDLRDRFGQRLGEPAELELHFGAASPYLSIPGAPFLALDPAVEGRLELAVRSVEAVDLELYRVEPGQWMEYVRGRRAREWRYGEGWTPAGEPLARWSAHPPDGGRGFSRVPVDLGEALGRAGGHALLVARGVPVEAPEAEGDTVDVARDMGRESAVRVDPRWPRNLRAATWIQTTTFAVGAAWDPRELVGWAVSLTDGRPLEGVELELPRSGSRGRTDAAGLARLTLAGAADSVLLARRGGEIALLPSRLAVPGGEGWMGNPAFPEPVWFTLTDRGLYRPGEELEGHGWIRELAGATRRDLSLPSSVDSVRYRVRSVRNRTLGEGTVPVTSIGSFHLVERLPSDVRSGPGYVELAAVRDGSVVDEWRTTERFRVEEFRRSEYDVAVELDPGPHVGAASVDARLRAEYWDGAGLPGSETRWRVQARLGAWTAPGWSGWRFGHDLPWTELMASTVSEELVGRTDAGGRHTLRTAVSPTGRPFPAALTIRAQVTDVSRQAGSADATTVVHPAAVYAAVRTDRTWMRAGEEVAVDVAVVDLEGRVVPDRTARVEAVLEPDSARPGSAATDEPVPLACLDGPRVTVADRSVTPLRCTLRPSSPGSYRIDAEVRDARGRRSLTQARIRVLGSGSRWILPGDGERMELTADRSEYHPGDTARVVVSVPFHPVDGLLTVFRHGFREVRPLRIDEPLHELRLPIRTEDAGGVWLGLDLSPSSRGHGGLSGRRFLRVATDERRLRVAVSAEPTLVEPGDRVAVDVTVSDTAGVSVAGGEIALWVVDESILALGRYALGDPLEALHRAPARPTIVLPHGAVHWARRPLGSGIISARVRDADTGNPAGRVEVSLDGEERGRLRAGDLLLRDVAPGEHRLVLSRDGMPVLERTVTVPREGLDLGTLLVDEPGLVELESRLENLSSTVLLRGAAGFLGSRLAAQRQQVAATTFDANPGASDESVEVRDVFRALAAFEAFVRLDDRGRARVTLDLPDTPTRYRIFAVAAHGARWFGTGEGTVTATRDLIVRASPPRILHPGDEPELPVIVQNASDRPMAVEVAARTTGLTLTGTEGYRVELPGGARTEVRFPARADATEPGTLEVVAVANGGTAPADAVRIPVPLAPALAPRAVAYHRTLAEGEVLRLPLEVPARAHPGFGAVDVGLSTTRLQTLTEALRSLCLQPMPWPSATTARVLGLAALDGTLEALRAPDLPPPDELRYLVEADIERLEGWLRPVAWNRSRSVVEHGFLSDLSVIHALHALQVAREAGYDVSPPRAGSAWLPERWRALRDTDLRDDGARSGWEGATAAYALHVGLETGVLRPEARDAEWLEALEPADLPVEMLAWLLVPARALPGVDPSVHAALLRELRNRALTTGATVTFRQGGRSPVQAADADLRRMLLASDRRSDAVALVALLEEDPEDPLIHGLVRGLLGHRDGTAAGGIHENGWVMLALGRYASGHEEDAAEIVALPTLDGEPMSGAAGPVALGPGRRTAVRSAPLPDPGRRAVLEVRREGRGPLHVRAVVRYAPRVTAETRAEERGFLVSRRYEFVDDSADVRWGEDGTWRIRAGARVRVRVTFTAPARRFQVQLRDPVPGGLEVVNPRLRGTGFADDPGPPPSIEVPGGGVSGPLASRLESFPYGWDLTDLLFRWRAWHGVWATHEELRDDRMEAYTPYLAAGTYQSTYLVRATTPGTFLAPPPRVEETEHPETFGQGTPDRIVVVPGSR